MSVRFPNAKFVAAAKVNGRLYDLGPYPGLQLDESSASVVGELYEVDDELLNELDEFETSSNYLRKQVEIPVVNNTRVCWTYEPDPDSYSLHMLIPSGDWVEYDAMKKSPPKPPVNVNRVKE